MDKQTEKMFKVILWWEILKIIITITSIMFFILSVGCSLLRISISYVFIGFIIGFIIGIGLVKI